MPGAVMPGNLSQGGARLDNQGQRRLSCQKTQLRAQAAGSRAFIQGIYAPASRILAENAAMGGGREMRSICWAAISHLGGGAAEMLAPQGALAGPG